MRPLSFNHYSFFLLWVNLSSFLFFVFVFVFSVLTHLDSASQKPRNWAGKDRTFLRAWERRQHYIFTPWLTSLHCVLGRVGVEGKNSWKSTETFFGCWKMGGENRGFKKYDCGLFLKNDSFGCFWRNSFDCNRLQFLLDCYFSELILSKSWCLMKTWCFCYVQVPTTWVVGARPTAH